MTPMTMISRLLETAGLLCSVAFAASVRAEEPAPTGFPAGYVEEAPLPEGFPPPSEPGKVVEKTYLATRSYSATGEGAFMKCFAYLSLNQHKMTAPVVMECKPGAKPLKGFADGGMPASIERMHFLLEKATLDEPKQAGPVKVADLPSMRVLSLAHQGEATPEAMQQGQAAIEARLKEMPDVERAGDYRILGYNSPMLARSKNFWEIQLPIQSKPKAK